ncbi:hypothetical protein F2P81_025586 [Scophthalmus maximus]|uniref:Uncharacterized protein n=1 Tax=Scophthalmus maximus TaxID=52904 RepID=A0A6A4RSG0_SCOMX|nr:hypothetical protein F2P81_025586 [Scophthalmus maximus]
MYKIWSSSLSDVLQSRDPDPGICCGTYRFALDNAAAPAAKLNVRSVCIISRLLEMWKRSLTAHKLLMLKDYGDGFIVPNANDPCPCLAVRSGFNDTDGFTSVHNSRGFNLDQDKESVQ